MPLYGGPLSMKVIEVSTWTTRNAGSVANGAVQGTHRVARRHRCNASPKLYPRRSATAAAAVEQTAGVACAAPAAPPVRAAEGEAFDPEECNVCGGHFEGNEDELTRDSNAVVEWVYEGTLDQVETVDCYRKVIEFVREHPDQYDPDFEKNFQSSIAETRSTGRCTPLANLVRAPVACASGGGADWLCSGSSQLGDQRTSVSTLRS